MENQYRLRIVRGSDEFEVEGDKEFVLSMLGRFEALGPVREAKEDESAEKPVDIVELQKEVGKSISVREFLQQTGFKRHTEIVLSFGYYIEHSVGKNEFTPADINNCYYEAKMEASNTSQAIIQNIKKGYVMEAKGDAKAKKRYTLTQTGERFIEKRITSDKS